MKLATGTPNPSSVIGAKRPKDRPLSEEESIAERRATILNKKEYPTILPFPGTLGFLLRNLRGGNEAVIQYLQSSVTFRNGSARPIKEILILWKNLDEFSKQRVDVFDQLCRLREIPPRKFSGWIAEGMFEYSNQENMIDLIEAKSELIGNIAKFANKEKNFKDRELLAKATKLTEESPLIAVNSVTNIQKNSLTIEAGNVGFADIIRKSEKLVASPFERKQLEAANEEDSIPVEFTVKKEKTLVN